MGGFLTAPETETYANKFGLASLNLQVWHLPFLSYLKFDQKTPELCKALGAPWMMWRGWDGFPSGWRFAIQQRVYFEMAGLAVMLLEQGLSSLDVWAPSSIVEGCPQQQRCSLRRASLAYWLWTAAKGDPCWVFRHPALSECCPWQWRASQSRGPGVSCTMAVDGNSRRSFVASC